MIEHNWSGQGTKKDPFIIEHYKFNGSIYYDPIIKNPPPPPTTVLQIENVNWFFIIQDNYFTNILHYDPTNFISFVNTSNGQLKNNLFLNNASHVNIVGINIESSNNIIFSNNTFVLTNNEGYDSSNFPIFSGLTLLKDNGCNLLDNTLINFQIQIKAGDDIILMGNTFDNSLIHVISSTTNISYNALENSYYGVYIDPESYSDATFNSRTGSEIHNNLFFNNSYGLYLSKANYLPVNYIFCPGYPECSELPVGYSGSVVLHYSNDIIKHNEFFNNTEKAIYIDQHNDNNTIYGNDFINNGQSKLNALNSINQSTTQVFENEDQNTTNNWFFNGVGNYWSDYNYNLTHFSVGSVPMHFLENDSDPFPLLKPVNNEYNYSKSHSLVFSMQLVEAGILGIFVISVPILAIIGMIEYNKYKKQKMEKKSYNGTFYAFLRDRVRIGKKRKPDKQFLSEKTLEMINSIVNENQQEDMSSKKN